jgi:hypothetical protein
VRDERRGESDHRTKVDVRHSRDRYPESSKGKDVAVCQFDIADRVQGAVLGQQCSAQYCTVLVTDWRIAECVMSGEVD